jgi:hypothetical protein
MKEEIDEIKSRHEKNWDATPQEELVEMKKLDLNYQQIVKKDLDEYDAVKREMLSRNLAALKRVKMAEVKLKQAPPNEVESIMENLERYEKLAKDALERELASTRRKLTTFEEILCSQRGVTGDEDALRSLFKREITAVKEKLTAQKKREVRSEQEPVAHPSTRIPYTNTFTTHFACRSWRCLLAKPTTKFIWQRENFQD